MRIPKSAVNQKWIKLILLLTLAIFFYEMVPRFLSQPSAPASFSGGLTVAIQDSLSSDGVDYLWTLVYCIGYPLMIYGAAIFLLWKRNFDGFVKYLEVFIIVQTLGVITWAIYPVSPPRMAIDGVKPTREIIFGFSEDFNPYPWGAFPSMHIANGLTAFFFVKRNSGRMAVVWIYLLSLVAFSALYLGEHYWQDIVAGCFYSLGSYMFVTRILRKDIIQNPIQINNSCCRD